MGYNTSYSLTIEAPQGIVKSDDEIVSALKKATELTEIDQLIKDLRSENITNVDIIKKLRRQCQAAEYALNESGDSSEPCTWYSHERDMRALSKEYPQILMVLHGEGEDGSNDVWNEYYLGGKMQREKAKIVIEPFDKTKLK